jgi:xanthine/uracil permease
MNKVIGCLVVALGLSILLMVDVRSGAPAWTIYAEGAGLALALIAVVLYYIQARDKNSASKASRKKTKKRPASQNPDEEPARS